MWTITKIEGNTSTIKDLTIRKESPMNTITGLFLRRGVDCVIDNITTDNFYANIVVESSFNIRINAHQIANARWLYPKSYRQSV